jgi:hypothetical protein
VGCGRRDQIATVLKKPDDPGGVTPLTPDAPLDIPASR